MKKWMYIIFPGAMLGLFLIAYVAETKRAAEREKTHVVEVERVRKEKEAKEATLKQKAEADAKKRADERAAEAKKKDDERIAKWEKESKEIQDAINKSTDAAAKSTKQIADMEATLKGLRDSRDKVNREYLDMLKGVEKARVDRRMAEMEIQRTTEMIAKKASESSMAKMPPPPPAPKAS